MVISAGFDNNFHHLISDSLTRLARHLTYLRRHPAVMLHMRQFELTRDPAEFTLMPHEVSLATKSRLLFFDLLGINASRIVHGPVIADTVYIPRETTCSYILRNPLDFRHLAKELMKSAKRYMSQRPPRDDKINYFSFDTSDNESIRPLTIYYQADDKAYTSSSSRKKNIVILHRQGSTFNLTRLIV
jgi:hypothetical protein